MSWQIVGDTFTLFGTGPVPRIVGGDTPPSTPSAPSVPPLAPPPRPPADTTPFVWPPDWIARYDPDMRYKWVWKIPGRADDDPTGKLYVMIANDGNPAGTSHHNAGLIQAGALVGMRLWAPRDAPDAMLNQIIKTGVWP